MAQGSKEHTIKMQFTGKNTLLLPQVKNFSFSINGIKLSDTGVVKFSIGDTGQNLINFIFSGGYILDNKIIGTYNTIESNNINGYFSNNLLTYKVNDILNQRTQIFTGLYSVVVDAGSSTAYCDLLFNSNPINYSVNFPSSYNAFGSITGQIISDTAFRINSSSFLFYNSNNDFLQNNYSTGLNINSGSNYLVFNDLDSSASEYTNDFYLSLTTPFGDAGGQFSSQRTGISNANILAFSDSASNVYYQTSMFDGYWSGNNFTYIDNPLTYNLSFSCSNTDAVGNSNNSNLAIKFQPIYPLQNSGYQSQYVTGFNLTNPGLYSGIPNIAVSQYFYVTGLQNTSSFLFSSGCSNSLLVSFTGGSPISGASGYLDLTTVYLSGIYSTGVSGFKIVKDYSGISNGWAYQSAPRFVLPTGGNCYSLPDYSGIEIAQFKKINSGYASTYMQAGGLTGIVIMTGSGVSGINVTNIGFGYSNSLLPKITFTGGTPSGNLASSVASGAFLMKQTGLYNFNQYWNILYNFGTGYSQLNSFNGYYSGNFNVFGQNNFSVQLSCSGLDNTSPISGLLSFILSGNGNYLSGLKTVSQSRTFDLNTGALLPNSYPVYSLIPLPDLAYLFGQDQYDSSYQSQFGYGDNIINF